MPRFRKRLQVIEAVQFLPVSGTQDEYRNTPYREGSCGHCLKCGGPLGMHGETMAGRRLCPRDWITTIAGVQGSCPPDIFEIMWEPEYDVRAPTTPDSDIWGTTALKTTSRLQLQEELMSLWVALRGGVCKLLALVGVKCH